MLISTIANVINKEIGISRSESSYFVDTVVNEMIKSLIEKKILKISSFGTLKMRFKKERVGRNPKTGVEHTISSRNTISFVASKLFTSSIKMNWAWESKYFEPPASAITRLTAESVMPCIARVIGLKCSFVNSIR